jgi:RNA polymerase sigma factor (TIGR02999 family)
VAGEAGAGLSRIAVFVSLAAVATVSWLFCKNDAPKMQNELYEELRRLAQQLMAREKPGQTLQATAVAHEVYLELSKRYPDLFQQEKRQVMACAAEVMKHFLVDQARRKKAKKRGGDLKREAMEVVELACDGQDLKEQEDFEELALALEVLKTTQPEAAELIHLSYFVGLSIAEAAEIMGMSLSAANRLRRYARAWLKLHLESRDS